MLPFQYGHVSALQSKKIRDEEQQLLELFNLETSKLRVLRTSQRQEEEERNEELKQLEEQKARENTTKKMNLLIARASKEDQEEETQVITHYKLHTYYVNHSEIQYNMNALRKSVLRIT